MGLSARHLGSAVLVVVGVVVAVAGYSVLSSDSREQDGMPERTERKEVPLWGEWNATGWILSSSNFANQDVGDLVRRRWAFRKICGPSGCRIRFLRMTLYGPSLTTLIAHDGYYTADFPPVATPCVGPGGATEGSPGRLFDTFRLWRSPDGQRIIASERQVGRGPARLCGPVSRQTKRWVATPAPARSQ